MRLPARWTLGPKGALLCSVFFATPAGAESGPAPCMTTNIVEVFPGAPGCEDADYVVVELIPEPSRFEFSDLVLRDACNEEWSALNLGDKDALMAPADSGASITLLIGSASVAQVFGVAPDVLLDERSPLSADGGRVRSCSDGLRYGTSSMPSPAPGQALRWTGSAWESGEPRPLNRSGMLGAFTGCDLPDAAVPAPSPPLVCAQPEPSTPPNDGEPPVVPSPDQPLPDEPDASDLPNAEQPPSPGPDAPSGPEPGVEPDTTVEPDTAVEPTPGSTTGPEQPGVPPPEEATSGDDAPQDDETTDGRSDSADGGNLAPPHLTGVDEATPSGCQCRQGTTGGLSPSSLVLFVGAPLSYSLRRRGRHRRTR